VNCSGIQERLSLFHDNQLSQDEAAHVAVHATECESCAAELAFFQQLSGLSRQLTDPPVPDRLWEELQAKLVAPTELRSVLARFLPDHVSNRLLALAATILVAIGMGAVAYQAWFSPGYDHLTVDFAQYLEEFVERPDDAQQILLAKYDGRSVSLTEAANVLGYTPVAAKGLPPEYSLEEVHLLEMPCCTSVQVMCKNNAGQKIAIFEHAIDQPISFSGLPTVKSLCHDIPTNVIQVGNRLAATWREGKRHITIIGATDLNEVTEFVVHFSEESSARM